MSNNPISNDSSDTLTTLHKTLTARATTLLSELTLFQSYISTHAPDTDVFLTRFEREVRFEADLLRQRGRGITSVGDDDGDGGIVAVEEGGNGDVNGLHRIRSSNISSYDAIWDVAKFCVGLGGLKRKVKFPTLSTATEACSESTRRKKKVPKETVTIDVIAEGGTKWIKVWTKSQRWLEIDMAKEGLVGLGEEEGSVNADEDEEGDSCGNSGGNRDGHAGFGSSSQRSALQGHGDGLHDLKLVKMAREYVAASKTSRINHKHPCVQFVLPKIYRGKSRDVDIVLEAIERLGVVVSCSGESGTAVGLTTSETELLACFERMLVRPEPRPCLDGHTLNLDCTVLIALVSDISHFRLRSENAPTGVDIPSHYHGQSRCDIYDQFQADEHSPLLVSDIYPVISDKQLICTSTAAAHLKKIVRLMGTETEARRAEILLGDMGSIHARSEWNNISNHTTPDKLQLPLTVVTFNLANALSDIQQQSEGDAGHVDSEVARRLSKLEERQLSDLNKAVFIYGWSRCVTTFTLNRVVSGFIDRTIDEILDDTDEQAMADGSTGHGAFVGPKIEVCARERSLIGSEKTCRNK